MKDILPSEIEAWQFLEATFQRLLSSYGYAEIRPPLLEKTELFKRAIGQVTDIVEKEMYTLEDKGGESLSLRPEGTAQCVRAALENGLLHNQTQRLWYTGPMFRRERPQKGRLRQFYQLGVEAFGYVGPDIDIELLMMTARLWERLNISSSITLELNSLGTYEERLAYRTLLVDYFQGRLNELDEDSLNRLKTNPLRILDSKIPSMQPLIQQAPSILDHLNSDSKAHFETIVEFLEQQNIRYKINSKLVRGLDYYTHTVYEWKTPLLGAQNTVCAGGRYDDLVKTLGGTPTPATGFALGIERLILVLQENNALPKEKGADVYLVNDHYSALAIAEELRSRLPQINLICHCGGGGFKSQFKKADKSGARWALVWGETERESNQIILKSLREELPQQSLSLEEVISILDKQ